MAKDRSFIRYHGNSPVRALGHDWHPGIGKEYRDIPLTSIFKFFKDRSPVKECGEEFVVWLQGKYLDRFKGKFVAHFDRGFYQNKTVSEEVLKSAEPEVELVESGEVQVADSQEQAMEALRKSQVNTVHTKPVPEIVKQTTSAVNSEKSLEGQVVVDTPDMSTSKAMSVQSVKEMNKNQYIDDNVMTGDDLDTNSYTQLNGNSYAVTPVQNIPDESSEINVIEIEQPNSFMANPAPNPNASLTEVVSTGQTGVITTQEVPVTHKVVEITEPSSETVESISSISGPGPVVTAEGANGDRVQVITGDNLQSTARSVDQVITTGKGTQVFQGTATPETITQDHIIRAATTKEAIESINKCTDYGTLKVAKSVLRNQGKQDLINAVDLRIQKLRAKGY